MAQLRGGSHVCRIITVLRVLKYLFLNLLLFFFFQEDKRIIFQALFDGGNPNFYRVGNVLSEGGRLVRTKEKSTQKLLVETKVVADVSLGSEVVLLTVSTSEKSYTSLFQWSPWYELE